MASLLDAKEKDKQESDKNKQDYKVSMMLLLGTTQPKLSPEKSKSEDTENKHIDQDNVNVCSGNKQPFENDKHLHKEQKLIPE